MHITINIVAAKSTNNILCIFKSFQYINVILFVCLHIANNGPKQAIFKQFLVKHSMIFFFVNFDLRSNLTDCACTC